MEEREHRDEAEGRAVCDEEHPRARLGSEQRDAQDDLNEDRHEREVASQMPVGSAVPIAAPLVERCATVRTSSPAARTA